MNILDSYEYIRQEIVKRADLSHDGVVGLVEPRVAGHQPVAKAGGGARVVERDAARAPTLARPVAARQRILQPRGVKLGAVGTLALLNYASVEEEDNIFSAAVTLTLKCQTHSL